MKNFLKLFKSCIVRNFKVKKETIFQAFLTKLVFWNLWSYWGHHWDLWGWSERWFSSSLTKIPHNVGFLPGWIQHCEEFFKNFSIPPGKNPTLWGIFHLTPPPTIEKMLEVVSIKMFQHWEEFFKNFSNPALRGILKWKVRSFFKYSSQS